MQLTDGMAPLLGQYDWLQGPGAGLVPRDMREGATKIALALRELEDVIVVAHVEPDGDAAGSMAVAGHLLSGMGHRHVLYCYGGLPGYLQFFPMPSRVYDSLDALPFSPRSALVLDCSDHRRVGRDFASMLCGLKTVNVDHHLGSSGLGTIANWIVPDAAATAQLMAYVAIASGHELAGDLGLAVGMGVITDTGGLRHGSTSAEIFDLCSHLAHNGCNLPDLRQQLDNCWSIGRMRLWGRLMQRARTECDGMICFCPVYKDDLLECGASRDDLEGFSEQLRRIAGVRTAVLLRQDAPDRCKVSLRSHGEVNVREMAATLGGGGHKNAAGININEPMEVVEPKLLGVVTQWLRAHPSMVADF